MTSRSFALLSASLLLLRPSASCSPGAACRPSGCPTAPPTPAQACTAVTQCPHDGNPCTVPSCSAAGVCTTTPVADGDRHNPTLAGTCKKRSAPAGSRRPRRRHEHAPEHGVLDRHVHGRGRRAKTVAKNGTACLSGSAMGTCENDACKVQCGQGFPPCNDGNPCTDASSCDLATSKCIFVAAERGAQRRTRRRCRGPA